MVVSGGVPGIDGTGSDGSLPVGFNSDPSVHHSVAPGIDAVRHDPMRFQGLGHERPQSRAQPAR
jgi:hypothetical protein